MSPYDETSCVLSARDNRIDVKDSIRLLYTIAIHYFWRYRKCERCDVTLEQDEVRAPPHRTCYGLNVETELSWEVSFMGVVSLNFPLVSVDDFIVQ